ncbi:hypothetical protein EE612_016864 [Oryza sativa]|nr:hypothetical protein EE612_016864 [Oryza sativa]
MATTTRGPVTMRLCFFSAAALFLLCFLLPAAVAEERFYEFVVQETLVKRLCNTQKIITVNGQFPGPTIEVYDGDTVAIRAVNMARYNVTLHWHGLRQLRNGWADGPEFVTQCPIRPGGSYTYRFAIQGQEGTLWWHAHSSWLRATVHGALLIRPRPGVPYPFPKPHSEFPIILAEWWRRDPIAVLRQSMITGAPPNVSDAILINGQPGDFLECSAQETSIIPVAAGETTLLRIINAAMNTELFVSLAGHKMTVVAADAMYTKPFETTVVLLGPGQTTDVLITAHAAPGRYYLAARAYASAQGVPFDNTTATAIFQYKGGAGCPTTAGGAGAAGAVAGAGVGAGAAVLRRQPWARRAGANAAVPAGVQRHEHGHGVLEQHPEPGAGEGARAGDPGGVHHGGVRPLQLHARPVLPGTQQHPVRREHEQRVVPAPQHRLPPAGALPPHPRRVHRRLPADATRVLRLHLPERPPRAVAAGEGHQAVPRQVRRGGADRLPGHRHLRRRGAPHAHPRLPLLRARHGVRQLRPGEGRPQVQPRRPAQPEHHRRARRRVGRRAVRGGQPRGVAGALPHRRASHRRAGHGAAGGGRRGGAGGHHGAAAGPAVVRPVEKNFSFLWVCVVVYVRTWWRFEEGCVHCTCRWYTLCVCV